MLGNTFKIALLSLCLTVSAKAAEATPPASASVIEEAKPNFEEIAGKTLSPATELALYRIHSHLKTCETPGYVTARLGVLWVSFRGASFNPRDFVNRSVSPAVIRYLPELYREAQKNPNCSALTFTAPGSTLPAGNAVKHQPSERAP
ncbi:MAG TPA: hypothetical protein VM901_00460 [Bdellovibrionota bacterium]|jgi:hypothetical protein|nr:hypothetical protein [Bdellovibrionota bacterium]